MNQEYDKIAADAIEVAFGIHRRLGPGLLESVYETIMAHELNKMGYQVERQKSIPIEYNGISFDEGFRADLVINQRLIIELKSVESIARVHGKQLLTYIRLMKLPLGLLINFGESMLKDGIKRVISSKDAEGDPE
jgi:iron complex transport system substrate-binding protein